MLNLGFRDNDDWEMNIEGPRGFERRHMLAGNAGEHQPDVTRDIFLRTPSGKT